MQNFNHITIPFRIENLRNFVKPNYLFLVNFLANLWFLLLQVLFGHKNPTSSLVENPKLRTAWRRSLFQQRSMTSKAALFFFNYLHFVFLLQTISSSNLVIPFLELLMLCSTNLVCRPPDYRSFNLWTFVHYLFFSFLIRIITMNCCLLIKL